MFRLSTDGTHAERWSHTELIQIGLDQRRSGHADFNLYIEREDTPFCLIRIYAEPDEYQFRFEVTLWHEFVTIGFGHKLHLLPLNAYPLEPISFDLAIYFGSLYPTEARLLVASATDLRSITTSGEIEWIAEHTGLDGVTIERTDAEFVYGAGEFDPPDGWKKFRVHLRTGVIDWLSTT